MVQYWGREQVEYNKRGATVLVADIRGFTRKVDNTNPEKIRRFIDEFFVKTKETVESKILIGEEGCINKFLGDGFLIFFEKEKESVNVALDLIKNFRCLANSHGFHELHLGIGITWGKIIYGTFGIPDFWDTTGIGSPINLCFRLTDKAEKGQILATRDVWIEVKDEVVWAQMPNLTLKGVPTPVENFWIFTQRNHQQETCVESCRNSDICTNAWSITENLENRTWLPGGEVQYKKLLCQPNPKGKETFCKYCQKFDKEEGIHRCEKNWARGEEQKNTGKEVLRECCDECQYFILCWFNWEKGKKQDEARVACEYYPGNIPNPPKPHLTCLS